MKKRMLIKILAFMGKTSCGKDTAAKYVKDEYGIEPIVSYATRPIRDNEVDGREHHFIDDEKMDEIVKDEENMLAFVQFPKTGYRYCASTRDLVDGAILTYIIDPSGLQWLKDHRPDVEVISVFFDLDESIIRERAISRGDKPELIDARLDSEREMFDNFAASGNYDFRIDTSCSREEVIEKIDAVMSQCGIAKVK